ncbi:MAG TPA: hypothetical protein VLI69_06410 [Gammaproteobacteria bacterium]|nr:hypothetical protein [Gammaproteobacteria bacterium]
MKVKSLLILVLASFTTSSIFANGMNSGNLISHKEWYLPNIKLTDKETQPGNSVFFNVMNKANMSKYDQFLETWDRVESIAVSKDDPTLVNATGEHSYYLMNNTSMNQIYTVTRSICTAKEVDKGFPIEQCSNISDVIQVDAGTVAEKSGTASLDWHNVQPGKYMVTFSTSVQNNTTLMIMYSSFDAQFITVPPQA